MNTIAHRSVNKPIDRIQQQLVSYACELNYDKLSPSAIHETKVRIIDTLGGLMAGFFGEPCHIVRKMAKRMPDPDGATVIGTRLKTAPDVAAFVNATTARYVEANDVYHKPGCRIGHPSDVVTPVLAAAEHARVGGRELITGVALAYEVYLRIADAVPNQAVDAVTFGCVGTAVAAGKLIGLTSEQLSHCISMAIVPNNILRQGKTGHLSMWVAVGAGQAGREGVFAALIARDGMEGPHLPFEGQNGWCNQIAQKQFSLDIMGGNGTTFKVEETMIKPRPSCAHTISPILAAEKIAPKLGKDLKDIKSVTVEVGKSKESSGSSTGIGDHHWNPDSRETADHSIPYAVAATLMDGTLTARSFNDDHLWNPDLRALLKKIKIVENPEFTKAYEKLPVEHRVRITLVTKSGEQVVGEAGGNQGDLSEHRSDAEIAEKFRGLTEDYLGSKRVNAILDRLWDLEHMRNVADIPPLFVLA